MKLYFSPGACSLSPHICLRETGAKFDMDQVDFGTKKTKSGADYTKVNPKGYVPALQLDDGEVLTEGPAIVQYVADQKPDSGLMPKAGTMERYRAQEWLNFITSELHKAYGHLFNPATPDGYKAAIKEKLGTRYDFLAKQLDGKPFLMGSQFGAPDAYLFTVLGWNPRVGMSLDKWPTLKAYSDRVAARPAVQAALKAEGLIK
ncbi:MAG TPA: glutathione transferase GstA [Methylomirabilota bacterium]|nr:glutathione transferase GstA [Methylomirabilota bacterium]